MGRDTIQLEDAVSTISQEYLLEFTFEYGIPKDLHPELPGPEETIVDFPEGKVGVYTKFFEFPNYRIPLPTTPITKGVATGDQVQDEVSQEVPPVENPSTREVVSESDLEQDVAATGPLVHKRRRKRGNDEADMNAPPKVLRKDHVAFRPAHSSGNGWIRYEDGGESLENVVESGGDDGGLKGCLVPWFVKRRSPKTHILSVLDEEDLF
ncbi:hypothetical protein Tco_0826899, partial [Tanacetum coccineum]